MKKNVVIFIGILILIQSCQSSNNHPKSAAELKTDLKMQERETPSQYLSIGDSRMNIDKVQTRKAGIFRDAQFTDDGATITGNIKNNATLAKFKDAVVVVSFSSSTNTIIEEKEFVLYKFFPPQASEYFSIKVYPPPSTSSFNVVLRNATPVYE